MYAEATYGEAGDTASLLSPKIPITTKSCLSFYFHMSGRGIGKLEVLPSPTAGGALWSMSGEKGALWYLARVSVPAGSPLVVFRSTRSAGGDGDVAVDDITVSPGGCPGNSK